ncbi:Peptidyl-prolyl cis-trans isomerase-like 4 [Coemansia sp. RSA 552]|nr:Peptidyl-prolyl cis-trans isomerase-like 4 [Coemansia sp. RSA 552]
MSVLVETSIGDIVIDLYTNDAPLTCKNFLKLCKAKYYNFTLFHRVEKGFIAQAGDPTGRGNGGQSIFGELGGSAYFPGEIQKKLRHEAKGTVSMACIDGECGSQFFITLADDLEYLDGKHAVFGRVAEGMDVVEETGQCICDDSGRPLKDILIRHTIVLDDPYDDPPGLKVPDSPQLPHADKASVMRIEAGVDEEAPEVDTEAGEKERRAREAKAQALTLEMIGDLPYADVKPPENILFVCKLNSATGSEDLETIFARFGQINSCQVICDKMTGDSLGYAFIEFDQKEACEEAYFKMDNVLIDDRRIRVDFSQSVSRLNGKWVRLQGREGRRGPGRNLRYKSHYRDEQAGTEREMFEMVFDAAPERSRHKQQDHHRNGRRRSRSPLR